MIITLPAYSDLATPDEELIGRKNRRPGSFSIVRLAPYRFWKMARRLNAPVGETDACDSLRLCTPCGTVTVLSDDATPENEAITS